MSIFKRTLGSQLKYNPHAAAPGGFEKRTESVKADYSLYISMDNQRNEQLNSFIISSSVTLHKHQAYLNKKYTVRKFYCYFDIILCKV